MSLEQTGTIRITDFRRYTGKIILDDGRESSILKFPNTYEDGDRAFVSFKGDDPDQSPLSLHAISQGWNYGVVVALNPRDTGSILITWPNLMGLVFLENKSLQAQKGTAVCFRLKKTRDGRLSAVEISRAPKDKYHYAQFYCGRLVRGNSCWKTGFIKNVINKDDHWFGFIEQNDGSKDAYFGGHIFQRAYNRKAVKGDIVYFKTTETGRGINVTVFNPSEDDDSNSTWTMITESRGKETLIRCPQNTFLNFLEPSPEQLYLVYKNREGVAVETRELRIERAPEAIAIVKDRNIPEELKLSAIDFLIETDLDHPEDFRAGKMRARKTQLLENIIDKLIAENRMEEALEKEVVLQGEQFNPDRLSRYSGISPSFALMKSEVQPKGPLSDRSEPWKIIF
nr:hypothetical protein [uncultured Dethiosulfovibrio sp.]